MVNYHQRIPLSLSVQVEGGVLEWEGLNFESSNPHYQCHLSPHVLVLAQQRGLAALAALAVVGAQR